MTRFTLAFFLLAQVITTGFADDSPSDTKQWEKKYDQLLKDRPEIRKKVESGGATKEQVIAWLKRGGDRKKSSGGKRYDGAKVEVKDPADFRKSKENVIYSGPQPGERLPAFKAVGLRGRHKGKVIDPVALADGKPLVLIFQDNSVVGQKGLLLCGNLLATIAENCPQGLHVSTTFLVDDPTLSKVFEYDFMDEIDNVIQMSVSRDRRDGPGAYGLNRSVAMTIIVARDGKVLHTFALKQPMLYPDPHVMGAIADVIGVDRSTLAGWFRKDKTRTIAQRTDRKEQADEKRDSNKTSARPEVTRQAEFGKKLREIASTGKISRQEAGELYRVAFPGGEAPPSAKRRREARRREYGRGKLEVKDPAGFKTGEKPVFSGPQPGEKLPALQVTSLAGTNQGEEFDLMASPVSPAQIIFFQDDNGVAVRGLFSVGGAIEKIRGETDKGLQIAVVFLADDVAKFDRYSRLFPQLIKLGVNSISVSKEGRDGPGAYGLDRTVSQTIILARDGEVTRSFVFPQGMLYADPHLMGGIAEILGEDRKTVAKWLAADQRAARREVRREGDRRSASRPLRAKLGEFVRAGKLTRQDASELYQAAFPDREIEKRESRRTQNKP